MHDDAIIRACFHPVEAAILRRALGLQPAPGDTQLDLWGRSCVVRPGVIRLEPSPERHVDEDRSVSDAAARLVLSGLAHRLPDYLATLPSGALVSARGTRRRRRQTVQSLPVFLFGINWADSGPGMSWPEHFHLGWLPGFDKWVVTGSRDSTDVDGYCDRMIGAFDVALEPLHAARSVIQADWQRQYDDESQDRWVELMGEGRLPAGEVLAMADAVWGEESDEGNLMDE